MKYNVIELFDFVQMFVFTVVLLSMFSWDHVHRAVSYCEESCNSESNNR